MSRERITNFEQVEAALHPYVVEAGRAIGKDITTERTLRLAVHVGSPEKKLRIVHVAGTSGKTSTCYYMAELLRESGKKVGLTVSPHMDTIAERVQINGQPLNEQRFCEYFNEFIGLVDAASEVPTYFEFMIVFAFWVFAREEVDYAVVETGMGGLHDSSNIAARPDKVCIITDIGLDHQHVLGRDITSIAHQKAGIIHAGNAVNMYHQGSEVDAIVLETADTNGATVIFSDEPDVNSDDTTPLYQQRNWRLAYNTYELVRKRDGLKELSAADLRESKNIHVPGRMDILERDGKTIVLDGAHNEQKMSTFLDSLRARFPGSKPAVLLSLKEGKEIKAIAPQIVDIASQIIVTRFSMLQDMPIPAADPKLIEAEIIARGGTPTVADTPGEGLKQLLESDESLIVVTGSLYLVAEIRAYLHSN